MPDERMKAKRRGPGARPILKSKHSPYKEMLNYATR